MTTLAAGAPIRGSWWGHAKAGEIFAVLERLAEHPDVLLTKLVSGKDTFVHRRLWPSLAAAALDRDCQHLADLSTGARHLLNEVRRKGRLEKERAAEARELDARLLILSTEYHTPSGAHAKRLESWESWAKRNGLADQPLPSPEAARELIARCVEPFLRQGHASLPWSKSRRR